MCNGAFFHFKVDLNCQPLDALYPECFIKRWVNCISTQRLSLDARVEYALKIHTFISKFVGPARELHTSATFRERTLF